MLITVIGRGHSGTRIMSHTLSASGVFMGGNLNPAGDLIPAKELYEACRIMAKHVRYLGDFCWDFTKLHSMPIDPAFTRLVESYLDSVLSNDSANKGWKLPETTLIYPWMVRLFPEIHYIHWVRDPRDSIMGAHRTDDLAHFGVPYRKRRNLRYKRAASWKYQRDIVKSTPPPKHTISVRFEDMVLRQAATLQRLEEFLGIPLAKIAVNTAPIGRWKNDAKPRHFDFLEEDMKELGYEPAEREAKSLARRLFSAFLHAKDNLSCAFTWFACAAAATGCDLLAQTLS